MSVAYPSWDLTQLLMKQRELSEAQRHHPSKIGTMIFPGNIIPAGVNIGLSRDDIATFQKAIQNVAKDNKIEPSAVTSVSIGILIVIDYRSAEKDEHHQTGYVLNLYYRDPARPQGPDLSLPIGADLPAEKLRLEQHLFGQYAD